MSDTLKVKCDVRQEHRGPHPDLRTAIDTTFPEPEDRLVAWQTVGLVRRVFPATVDILAGPLIWQEEREE
jgi:hypothetical protein